MKSEVLAKLYDNSKSKPEENAVHFIRWYTYKELARLVDKTATFLLKNGYTKDSAVPLYFEPSIEALILIYASLKIGSYYVPFNSSQPIELIRDLLNDCSNHKIICSHKDLKFFDSATVFDISVLTDTFPTDRIENGLYAYQLFTSGTTGRPKGVLITTENLNYFTNVMKVSFCCHTQNSLLWTTSWTFDVSIVQLFGFIINAGRLVIPVVSTKRALTDIPRYVQNYSITHLNLVPTVLSGLLSIWSNSDLKTLNDNLKFVMVAGEKFKLELGLHIKKILPDVTILNLYGPTETTVYATIYEVTGKEQGDLPIGKPLKNCEILILSGDLSEVLSGEIGEICISGQGVAAGYVNNNVLTESRFVHLKNKSFYRTGDFGRINDKGEIEYFGRRDRQVKIYGTRIELEEIEAKLNSFFAAPGQVRAIYENSSIYVFYVGDANLRILLAKSLKNWLPSYAQPSTFINVTEFPTTSSGKLDEKALLNLVNDFKKNHSTTSKSDLNHMQSIVCKAFSINQEKLDVPFSDLGNDSLATVLAIVQIENELSLSVPDSAVIGKATPADLIKLLASQDKTSSVNNNTDTESTDLPSNVLALQKLWKNMWFIQNDERSAYAAHALQRLYYFDGFESTLLLRFKFAPHYTVEQIEKAILKVIFEQQLLYSYLHVREEKKLKFTTKNTSRIFQIPKLNISVNMNSSIVDKITEQLTLIDKRIVTEQILHTPLLIISRSGIELIWTLSHLICDQASIYVLKRQIVEKLDSVDKKTEMRLYSTFVDFQNKKSDPAYFENSELTYKLLALNISHTYEIEKTDQIKHIILNPPVSREMTNKIGDICFQIGRILGDELNIEKFAISTIVNIRSFSEFNAEDIVGDCHSTVVVPYDHKEDKVKFLNCYQQIFSIYKNGGSPYFAAFSTFPVMSETQKILEKAYDTIPIVGINYLGAVTVSDLEDIQKNLNKAKKSLMSFPGKRIYVTVFEDIKGTFHAYFLTYPLKDKV